MKITYIKLVNFCNIHSALKSNKLEIDFSNNKNKVILITGPNGSGKTSTLSCLHPFAYNGNLDVRSDLPIILQGRNGEKEIHIENGNDKYAIKHFYTPSKESHTVKSYIEKNGIDLNPNGNVTSFKEIIKDELELETDFLKLIRLGSNVTNFIDLKATERKAFMGRILSEVDVYLSHYKKITNDIREVKSVISHLSDKIQKLGIPDNIEELLDEKERLSNHIDETNDALNKLRGEMGAIDHDLLKHDSLITINEGIKVSEEKLKKIEHSLKGNDISIEECDKLILDTSNSIIEKSTKKDSMVEKRKDILDNLDRMMRELGDIKRELFKIENNSEITDTESIISELKNTLETRSRESHLAGYNPPCSEEEMKSLLTEVDICNDILTTTYEFGRQPIEKALRCIEEKQSIVNYVNQSLERGSKNRLQHMSEFLYHELIDKMGEIKVSCDKMNSCPVYKFYDEIYTMATETPDEIVEDETFIMYLKLSYQNIMDIIEKISSHKSTIEKLPEKLKDLFKVDTIFNRIRETKSLCDKEPLYGEMSSITDFELQERDRERLKTMKEKLSLLKKSVSNSEYFENRKSELVSSIDDLRNSLSEISSDIDDIDRELDELKSNAIKYGDRKDAILNKDSVNDKYIKLCLEYEEVSELFSRKSEVSSNIANKEGLLRHYTNEFNALDYRLNTYKTLSEEVIKYSGIFDDMNIIRDSLSSKSGIPLYYIQIYLQNIKVIANDLLDVIYNGELALEDFDINADEFTMPYYTKGTLIKDVSHASQGEKSFISLAISFGLIYESISKYNILLLDEIDATLDTSNRMKFIQVLEKWIDMIDAEQLFLISHNNMFSMYPVSVMSMNNSVTDENKNADLIKIKLS